MTSLNLDLGTDMGWAALTGSGALISGQLDWKNHRFVGGGMRYLQFRKWLEKFHAEHKVKEVHFEEVHRHRGVAAAHAYGGFLATLTVWCEENKIPYLGHGVGTIKMHATGNGSAKKDEMIAAAKEYGFNPKYDDEADAICLMYLVQSGLTSAEIKKNRKISKRRRKVVDELDVLL